MYEHGAKHSLGDLVDVHQFNSPIEIQGVEPDILFNMLKSMVLIRAAEEGIGKAIIEGLIKTPCHLGIGQEAIAVGLSLNLKNTDYVFGTHRAHSHYLAMGGGVYELMAEVLGKADGASKGMGGSMHLYGGEFGFLGSVPIVGGTIPIAVGAAMAAKMDRKGGIAVCYFGDGAAEEGVLHESLNLASAYNLPVLFVCENNLYSSHLDIKVRQPSDSIARFADAHCIVSKKVDGNDVVQLSKLSNELINDMRANPRPYFIEAVTYRWRGHVGPDENIDVGVRRSKAELGAWKLRDPIKRLVEGMINEKLLDEERYQQLIGEINQFVSREIAKAKHADYPCHSLLSQAVYKDSLDVK
jgi:pyruvate dehydrogenase E1 component alpha subunit